MQTDCRRRPIGLFFEHGRLPRQADGESQKDKKLKETGEETS
jgi:hypothetical protein